MFKDDKSGGEPLTCHGCGGVILGKPVTVDFVGLRGLYWHEACARIPRQLAAIHDMLGKAMR